MSLQSDPHSTYRIFISFNDKDQALAEYLAKGLRRILDDYDAVYEFLLPGRYNSKAGPRPADDFRRQIEGILRKCNIFILLWSTHARDSKYVRYEFNIALDYHISEAMHSGHQFKIVPIRINKCGLHIGISRLERIDYFSGGDMQNVLNEVLATLSLPAEHDETAVRVMREAAFDIRTAYYNGEWAIVTQKYPNFLQIHQTHPEALSATLHYMYVIALFKQGDIDRAKTFVREGLGYVQHEEDRELLYTYVLQVREKKLWDEVLYIAEKGIELFPDDDRWHRLRIEAFDNLNPNRPNTTTKPPTSILLQPQQQQPPSSEQSPQMNVNGTTRLLVGNETVPLSYLQQSPYLSSSALFSPPTQEFPLTHNAPPVDPVTEQIPVVGNLSHPTQELLSEEFQPEDGTGVWGRDFIRTHFSSQKLHRLLSGWLLCIAILDLLCLYLITLAWPVTATWMAWEFAIVGIGLCIGRMVEAVEFKLLCLVAFCILWGMGGYSIGSQFLNWLGLGVNASVSFRNLMGIFGVIIGIAIVWGSHFKLFYQKR